MKFKRINNFTLVIKLLSYQKFFAMLLNICYIIIAAVLLHPKKIVCSSSNDSVLVIIKSSDSIWFLEDLDFYSYFKLLKNDDFREEPLIIFTSYNYTTSLEIILDVIIGKTLQTQINQRGLILIATDIDKDSTALISDIIVQYQNILHFDVNSNNYEVSYQLNSAPIYFFLHPEDLVNSIIGDLKIKKIISMAESAGKADDDMSDFYNYALINTDLDVIEYSINFENNLHMPAIVNDLIKYENMDKLNILYTASFSSLNIFLGVCENKGVEIGTVYLSSNNISFENAKVLKKIYKNTVHSFIFFDKDLTRDYFCSIFLANYSSLWLRIYFNFRKRHIYNILINITDNEPEIREVIRKDTDAIKLIASTQITCLPGFERKTKRSETEEKKVRRTVCSPCPENYFKETSEKSECQKCPFGFTSNVNKTICKDPFTLELLSIRSIKGFLITAFSIFCSLFCIFTIATLLHKRETPVVKSANFLLFTVQIVCHLIISLSVPFLYLNEVVFVVCSTRHIIVGFFFTLSASIIYIKTRKYLRIFQRVYRLSNKEKIVATSIDVMVIAFILIVQMLMGAVLLIKSPPAVLPHLNYEKMTRTFQCSSDWQFAAQVLYIGFLLLMCCVQSFHARNLPSYFNETHSITYSTGISCILLICYFPIYYGNDDFNARIFMIALLITTVNFTLMGIVFTPKLFAIYLKPKINTKNSLQDEMKRYSKSVSGVS